MKRFVILILIIILALTGVSCRGTAGTDMNITPEASPSVHEPSDDSAGAAEGEAGDKNVIMLRGTIGELPVHMSLTISDGIVTGSYYYDRVGKELKLEGSTEADRMIYLDEYDENGELTGKFDGWYTRGIRITGSWTNAKTDAKLDFNLSIIGGIPANAVWAGEWHRMDTGCFDSATLAIFNETNSSFEFQLDAFSGSHMGFVDGKALIDGKTAIFKDKDTSAELTFSLAGGLLEVVSGGDISYYAGMGVAFDGSYTKEALPEETLLAQGYLGSEEQEDAFRAMTGKDYELFLNTAQLGYEEEDRDGFGAQVYRWTVRGLSGYAESIVMQLPDGGLCAAVLDPEKNNFIVYTNEDIIVSPPRTILAWIADIQEAMGLTGDLPVEFCNTNEN
jgi:hypothetical protein